MEEVLSSFISLIPAAERELGGKEGIRREGVGREGGREGGWEGGVGVG